MTTKLRILFAANAKANPTGTAAHKQLKTMRRVSA